MDKRGLYGSHFESVTKDAYRIWRERNPNKRSNLTNNELMNQRRYIERRNKLK